MTILTGKDAEEFAKKLRDQHDSERTEALAEEKQIAAARGKEPFDLEKLEEMCDTSSEGRLDPLEERRTAFEYRYYVNHPEIMTLEEFAAYIEEVSKW